MLSTGLEAFEGGTSTQQYIRITGYSKVTVTRDLVALLKMGAIRKLAGGGRSTRDEVMLVTPQGLGWCWVGAT